MMIWGTVHHRADYVNVDVGMGSSGETVNCSKVL
jgi:hypothetical protein